MALIAARGIGMSFGSRSILGGLDFDVEPGARLGVIGPNGGGKSTLLRILAGEEAADAGEVTQRRGLVIAFLPQQPEGDERDASIRDCSERLGVCRPFGSGMRSFPATDLRVEFLAVLALDPVVQRPPMLRRVGDVECLHHFGHRSHRNRTWMSRSRFVSGSSGGGRIRTSVG